MRQLLKKTFIMKVLWKEIEYKQLSFYEALEFDNLMRQQDFNIVDRFVSFLEEKGINKKQSLKQITVEEMNKFFKTYIDTAMRWYYAKNKKTNEDKPKKWIPESSYIVFICKEMNIDPMRLLNEYTPEAINFLWEWIQWNLNEQTKEGRERNRQAQIGKDLREVDKDRELEELNKMREKKKLLQAKKDK